MRESGATTRAGCWRRGSIRVAKRPAEKNAAGETFETIAREWLALQAPRLGAGTLACEMSQLERLIVPELGAKHGLRSMASTCLNEQGWHHDLIELQLAHAERNKIRAAYNRASCLAERRRMMQAWADYLGGLINLIERCARRGGCVAVNYAALFGLRCSTSASVQPYARGVTFFEPIGLLFEGVCRKGASALPSEP